MTGAQYSPQDGAPVTTTNFQGAGWARGVERAEIRQPRPSPALKLIRLITVSGYSSAVGTCSRRPDTAQAMHAANSDKIPRGRLRATAYASIGPHPALKLER